MFREISYMLIDGRSLIMYLGIITLLCFATTATIGFLTFTGIRRFPISWHLRMAALSLSLALIHGTLGVLAYL